MAGLQRVRGTQDILPAAMRRHRLVIDTARVNAERYRFEEMATPIFEFTEVFSRPIGEATDIVAKEMYTFTDGDDEITLRPENTAAVARAAISNGLLQELPLRYFYAGPMFRHERPQALRYRQFHQVGVELIGIAEPMADIEVVALGVDILNDLGVLKHTELQINTLGDQESRDAYRARLRRFYTAHHASLSEDSRRRLELNPLRILDSKNPGDIAINAEAPSFADDLTERARRFFEEVRAGLDALDIAYKVNPRLVRGLDYYCHTAFEFVTTDLGAQGTVLGGGRYDGLMALMGGPPTPGVGWAAGVERLASLIAEPPPPSRPIALIALGAAAEARALLLAHELRRAGFSVDALSGGNLAKRLRRANKMKASAAVILGEDELARGAAGVRDLDSGEQVEVALPALQEALARLRR
ncbi:MAG TPA: histidine--tRNA ligase [Stellaceae bacterium]|nr:histidine--tRNA ligase [Stellaceae bacterium]